jgi:hypothetical protein
MFATAHRGLETMVKVIGLHMRRNDVFNGAPTRSWLL